ncbi:hypothetical protein JRQ81_013063 [Phrynocephalus forsythii]|uniref:Uncharacterized protein n=1 Tax=Phrynocephalus forsythii TaxID=171643 RepID=A0A9Q0XZ40_9SAUR|nr:hypothetical protein JRQ81_013063 [Phrynocephalus forsythii]
MEPPRGVERQVEELQRTLRLLVGLILPCLGLLFLLSCLFLLRWRPARGKKGVPARGLGGWAPPAAAPHLLPGVPQAAGARVAGRHLRPPGASTAGLSGRPPPPSCCRSSGGRASPGSSSRRPPPPRTRLGFCSQTQARGQPRDGAPSSTSSSSTSSTREEREVLAPPNSPATSSGMGGTPHGRLAGYLTSTQDKARRSATTAHSHSTPFEYGSSIRWEDGTAKLNSANFTASQGPGLDTDFGVSAGVSVRIVSSDSEESPQTPLLHRQRLGQLEWDYYDPRYQKTAPLHHQPPPVGSKQYWL